MLDRRKLNSLFISDLSARPDYERGKTIIIFISSLFRHLHSTTDIRDHYKVLYFILLTPIILNLTTVPVVFVVFNTKCLQLGYEIWKLG